MAKGMFEDIYNASVQRIGNKEFTDEEILECFEDTITRFFEYHDPSCRYGFNGIQELMGNIAASLGEERGEDEERVRDEIFSELDKNVLKWKSYDLNLNNFISTCAEMMKNNYLKRTYNLEFAFLAACKRQEQMARDQNYGLRKDYIESMIEECIRTKKDIETEIDYKKRFNCFTSTSSKQDFSPRDYIKVLASSKEDFIDEMREICGLDKEVGYLEVKKVFAEKIKNNLRNTKNKDVKQEVTKESLSNEIENIIVNLNLNANQKAGLFEKLNKGDIEGLRNHGISEELLNKYESLTAKEIPDEPKEESLYNLIRSEINHLNINANYKNYLLKKLDEGDIGVLRDWRISEELLSKYESSISKEESEEDLLNEIDNQMRNVSRDNERLYAYLKNSLDCYDFDILTAYGVDKKLLGRYSIQQSAKAKALEDGNMDM